MVFDVRILAPAAGLVGALAAIILFVLLLRQPAGTEKMRAIADDIRAGAMTFLKAQFARAGIFLVVIAALVAFFLGPWLALTFALGGLSTALIGWFGLSVSTRANVRTSEAARSVGAPAALRSSLNGAAAIGLFTSSVPLIVIGGLFYFFDTSGKNFASVVAGFSLGASAIALYARLGGGIFSTAADIGSDLAGKVDSGIPEDDARNPGVIADSVGDNVGGIAGMGADIFESFVGAIVAAVILASFLPDQVIRTRFGGVDSDLLMGLPLFLVVIGLGASLFAVLFANITRKISASKTVIVVEFVALLGFLGAALGLLLSGGYTLNIFYSVLIGAVSGYVIGKIIQIYTSGGTPRNVAEAARSGVATNFMAGLAAGFESASWPLIVIAAAIVGAYLCAGAFGISLAAVGMLATIAMIMTLDSYGPITDNASGIAEMANLGTEVRKITDELDTLGNRTATIGKGFSIAAATMTSLSLFLAFEQALHARNLTASTSVAEPKVFAGILAGALIVLFVSSVTMKAVARAAAKVVVEIRRQFREIPGLLNGTGTPDNSRCIQISAEAALKEMNLPVVIAVVAPVLVGKLAGPDALGGLLVGAIVTGVSFGLFMSNSGGIWASARRQVELGAVAGERRGSRTHQATVIGDSVGDPMKDTAGPALNILIKVMAIVSLLIVPLI